MFRFSKLEKNGNIEVVYKDRDGVRHDLPCLFSGGQIDISGFASVDPTESEEVYNMLVRQVNWSYRELLKRKAVAKAQREELKAANHWWNRLSVLDKQGLVKPLKDRLISIVDELMKKDPHNIKARHYESLIKRSQVGELDVTRKIDIKKLNKLPRLDTEHGYLRGSLYSFITLAEVCYPPMVRQALVMRMLKY